MNVRVQEHRDALRKAGLRPLQISVPDTRQAHFAEECRRQSMIAAQVDLADAVMLQFLDATVADMDGWTA
jgi:hypothetical protein